LICYLIIKIRSCLLKLFKINKNYYSFNYLIHYIIKKAIVNNETRTEDDSPLIAAVLNSVVGVVVVTWDDVDPVGEEVEPVPVGDDEVEPVPVGDEVDPVGDEVEPVNVVDDGATDVDFVVVEVDVVDVGATVVVAGKVPVGRVILPSKQYW